MLGFSSISEQPISAITLQLLVDTLDRPGVIYVAGVARRAWYPKFRGADPSVAATPIIVVPVTGVETELRRPLRATRLVPARQDLQAPASTVRVAARADASGQVVVVLLPPVTTTGVEPAFRTQQSRTRPVPARQDLQAPASTARIAAQTSAAAIVVVQAPASTATVAARPDAAGLVVPPRQVTHRTGAAAALRTPVRATTFVRPAPVGVVAAPASEARVAAQTSAAAIVVVQAPASTATVAARPDAAGLVVPPRQTTHHTGVVIDLRTPEPKSRFTRPPTTVTAPTSEARVAARTTAEAVVAIQAPGSTAKIAVRVDAAGNVFVTAPPPLRTGVDLDQRTPSGVSKFTRPAAAALVAVIWTDHLLVTGAADGAVTAGQRDHLLVTVGTDAAVTAGQRDHRTDTSAVDGDLIP